MDNKIRGLQRLLSTPPTDWDEIYLRVKFSPIGADFTPERFLTTPIRKLFRILEYITEYEERFFNYASTSVAHLNNQLMWAFYGLGGGQGAAPTATYRDFLPFPEAGKRRSSHEPAGVTEETRQALKRALGTGQLPYDIFVELYRGPR